MITHYESHYNENSITAALGQELIREPLHLLDTSVVFHYRNFGEQHEEPETGADGGILIRIKTQTDDVEKAVLFQAKQLFQNRHVRSLSVPRNEARRLRRQVEAMRAITDESIMLAYTRQDFYAIDAVTIESLTLEQLRHPLKNVRLIGLGAFLGKWVARCSRGDFDPNIVARVRYPRGFLRDVLELNIKSEQRLLLSEGDSEVVIDPSQRRGIPQPRWRR